MTKLKKLLAVLLTLATLLTMVPVTALAAETEEVPAEVVGTAEAETSIVELEEIVIEEEPKQAEEQVEVPVAAPEIVAEAEETSEVAEMTSTSSENAPMIVANTATSTQGVCGANLTWTLSTDGTLTISGTGAMYDFIWPEWGILPPWYYSSSWNDYIDSDGSYSWYYKNDESNGVSVKKVILKEGVTSISDYAFFRDSGITSFTIPKSVTSIGKYAIGYGYLLDRSDMSDDDYPFSIVRNGNPTIYGYSGTSAETYAKKNSITFVALDAQKLSTPVLSKVENVNDGVKVTWGKVTGAAQYRVYRRVSGGSWAALGNTTSTSYTDTKAAAGTLYAYTVRCVSADGKSFTSGYDTTGKGIVRLTNPVVTVANVTAGVSVQWSKVAGAKGYYVYRKTGSGSYSKIATITSGSTVSYGDKTAVGGTTYTYTVRAYNGAYLSSFAGKSIVRLTNPAVTVANASGGVVVSWSKVAGAKGYYVYRKTSGGSYTRIKTITSGSTVSVGDTAVKSTNGTLYTYTVRAYNGSVLSSFAGKNIVRLTTPTISSVTNSASKAITVKWNRNTAATGYQVYYKVGTTAKAVTVAGNANLSKVITGLTKGSTYTVYVRSYKTVSGVNYYSGWSASKTVKISK